MAIENTPPRERLIDCHSDLMVDVFRRRREGEGDVLSRRHLPGLREGGVVACVCSCGGDARTLRPREHDDPYANAVAMLQELHADVAESDGRVAVVTSTDEMVDCIERGALAVLPGLEGASPIQGDLTRLEELHERGVRVVGLTWNSRNELAVGLDSGDGGLTPLGARAVEAMNRLGIMIDLAHASPSTFWDVAGTSSAPLVVSHANAKGVWDHPRNLDDDQLEAVRTSGGVVGLTLYPSFIGPQPVTLEMLLDHADYLIRRIGITSVAIGADFIDYALDEMLGDLRSHTALYPEGSFTFPAGLESASGLQNLVRGLESRGFDSDALSMIGVSNFLRALGQTERIAIGA
jgi:membrane dipeptidase